MSPFTYWVLYAPFVHIERHKHQTEMTKGRNLNMKFTTKVFSAALLTTAMVQPAMAQQNAARAAQMQQQTQQIQINQQHIENYADARQEVDKIGNKWRDKVEGMDAAQQKELNNKLVNTVKESGLTVEEYNAISGALQQNKELQQRIIQAMQ